MKGLMNYFYHFYQYKLKPNKRHKTVIKRAKAELQKIRQLQTIKSRDYLFGVLRNIDPFVFEKLILLCFKENKFKVKRNHRHTGDNGIDGTLFNSSGNKLLIQVKRYRQAINPQHILDFKKTIQTEHAVGRFFVHTSRTGPKSKQFLPDNIQVLSGDCLLAFILGG